MSQTKNKTRRFKKGQRVKISPYCSISDKKMWDRALITKVYSSGSYDVTAINGKLGLLYQHEIISVYSTLRDRIKELKNA